MHARGHSTIAVKYAESCRQREPSGSASGVLKKARCRQDPACHEPSRNAPKLDPAGGCSRGMTAIGGAGKPHQISPRARPFRSVAAADSTLLDVEVVVLGGYTRPRQDQTGSERMARPRNLPASRLACPDTPGMAERPKRGYVVPEHVHAAAGRSAAAGKAVERARRLVHSEVRPRMQAEQADAPS